MYSRMLISETFVECSEDFATEYIEELVNVSGARAACLVFSNRDIESQIEIGKVDQGR